MQQVQIWGISKPWDYQLNPVSCCASCLALGQPSCTQQEHEAGSWWHEHQIKDIVVTMW